MNMSVKGKVVLITGASRGLGKATALEFASQGAKLALAARTMADLEKLRLEIQNMGGEAIAVDTDVTSPEAVQAMVNETLRHFGHIDILMNNAGIARFGSAAAPGFGQDVHDIARSSLFGMISVTQAVLPVFNRQNSGVIVNMSSVMGRKAFEKFGAYAIVMHAVSAFSDALRQELRNTHVSVTVVHPALTETELLRDADPADIPPPFRHLTPISAALVAREIVIGVRRGKPRIIVPKRVNMLILGDAFSTHIGDWLGRQLAQGWLPKLLRLSSKARFFEISLSGAFTAHQGSIRNPATRPD